MANGPHSNIQGQARHNKVTGTKDYTFEHWKYPETVGNDSWVDDINFNSHATSDYAKLRMNRTDTMTIEPFVMFEFMKVDESEAVSKMDFMDKYTDGTLFEGLAKAGGDAVEVGKDLLRALGMKAEDVKDMSKKQMDHAVTRVMKGSLQKVESYVKGLTTPVKRDYTGSIAMYMPTDIQVNDQMMYNEDSRKFAAALEEFLGGGMNSFENKAVTHGKSAITAYGGILGKMGSKGMLGALAGYGVGDIVASEIQRSTGQTMNKNEYIQYASTALRAFTFTWTFLPDSENESKHAAGIVKFFRKSAHAKKNSSITITVPDHCIVSFHGAKDMIQLPPCVVESVNVTYNPNVSSFFKINNSPVEIALAVTLKEMVPIYTDDVEAGY
jgi:hypothetical protein